MTNVLSSIKQSKRKKKKRQNNGKSFIACIAGESNLGIKNHQINFTKYNTEGFLYIFFRIEAWKKLDNLARANPDIHKLTSLMKECTFMEIETVDIVNAVSMENNDDDKLIMNNINNLMAVDDNDDR